MEIIKNTKIAFASPLIFNSRGLFVPETKQTEPQMNGGF